MQETDREAETIRETNKYETKENIPREKLLNYSSSYMKVHYLMTNLKNIINF